MHTSPCFSLAAPVHSFISWPKNKKNGNKNSTLQLKLTQNITSKTSQLNIISIPSKNYNFFHHCLNSKNKIK